MLAAWPDVRLDHWFQDHRVHWLNWLFVDLTRIGTYGAVWVLITVCLALVRRRPAIMLTIAVVFVADAVTSIFKVIVERPRPHYHPLVHVPASPSFPSGHSATSFAAATMLSLIEPPLAPVFFLLAVGIAFSRVYVGVHYPIDVLAGAALGCALGWAGFTSLRMLERSLPRSRRATPRA